MLYIICIDILYILVYVIYYMYWYISYILIYVIYVHWYISYIGNIGICYVWYVLIYIIYIGNIGICYIWYILICITHTYIIILYSHLPPYCSHPPTLSFLSSLAGPLLSSQIVPLLLSCHIYIYLNLDFTYERKHILFAFPPLHFCPIDSSK